MLWQICLECSFGFPRNGFLGGVRPIFGSDKEMLTAWKHFVLLNRMGEKYIYFICILSIDHKQTDKRWLQNGNEFFFTVLRSTFLCFLSMYIRLDTKSYIGIFFSFPLSIRPSFAFHNSYATLCLFTLLFDKVHKSTETDVNLFAQIKHRGRNLGVVCY